MRIALQRQLGLFERAGDHDPNLDRPALGLSYMSGNDTNVRVEPPAADEVKRSLAYFEAFVEQLVVATLGAQRAVDTQPGRVWARLEARILPRPACGCQIPGDQHVCMFVATTVQKADRADVSNPHVTLDVYMEGVQREIIQEHAALSSEPFLVREWLADKQECDDLPATSDLLDRHHTLDNRNPTLERYSIVRASQSGRPGDPYARFGPCVCGECFSR